MKQNLLNIDFTKDIDTPIYRVFNIQRFLTLLESNKNTLVKPELWDDPFENFILKVAADTFPAFGSAVARRNFYGQCWTLKEESDAMWRIYSADKNGVKVKTTIRKLFDSLNSKAKFGRLNCFIGKVLYLPSKELKEKLENMHWLRNETLSYKNQATSLLFKRNEFEHEQEVRLLYHMEPLRFNKTDLFEYSIKPLDLFDEIQFDPRISPEMFNVFRQYLKYKKGYSNPITRSVLYQLPKLKIKNTRG